MDNLDAAIALLENTIGVNYIVERIQMTGNNGQLQTALSIQEKASLISVSVQINDDVLLESPTIIVEYVNKIVVDYLSGMDRNALNKDHVLKNVVYKLINARKNADELRIIPHKDFLDMALIYRVLIDDETSYLIRDDYMKLLGLTIEEIDEAAKKNTFKEDAIRYGTIQEFLMQCLIPDIDASDLFGELPLSDCPKVLMLTNKTNIYGAALMTNTDILEHISNEMGSDLVIIPSSVHEVLLLKKCQIEDLRDLINIVREVNGTLRESEVLSDNLYFYKRGSDRVSVLTVLNPHS